METDAQNSDDALKVTQKWTLDLYDSASENVKATSEGLPSCFLCRDLMQGMRPKATFVTAFKALLRVGSCKG